MIGCVDHVVHHAASALLLVDRPRLDRHVSELLLKELDLMLIACLILGERLDGGPVALESPLLEKAERCLLLTDRAAVEDAFDVGVHVARYHSNNALRLFFMLVARRLPITKFFES